MTNIIENQQKIKDFFDNCKVAELSFIDDKKIIKNNVALVQIKRHSFKEYEKKINITDDFYQPQKTTYRPIVFKLKNIEDLKIKITNKNIYTIDMDYNLFKLNESQNDKIEFNQKEILAAFEKTINYYDTIISNKTNNFYIIGCSDYNNCKKNTYLLKHLKTAQKINQINKTYFKHVNIDDEIKKKNNNNFLLSVNLIDFQIKKEKNQKFRRYENNKPILPRRLSRPKNKKKKKQKKKKK